jgi:hypothetical protein
MEHRTQTLRSIWFHKLPCEGTAFTGCGETCKNWRLGFLKGRGFQPRPFKTQMPPWVFFANHADQDRQIWADL